MAPDPTPTVGQTWADRDPRTPVTVIVREITEARGRAYVVAERRGRRTRVRVDVFVRRYRHLETP